MKFEIKSKSKQNMENLVVRFPPSLRGELEKASKQSGVSVSEFVRQAVEYALKQIKL